MPVFEDIKAFGEKLTGYGRPKCGEVIPVARKAHTMQLQDDGETPNNACFPVLLYRSPIKLRPQFDPAAILESLFDSHGWRDSWRDGIYDFLHFHTGTHEVLGFARGWVKIQLGGRKGRTVTLKAGDVVVLPAGTGHRRVAKSSDLLVVGAYPGHGRYDEPKPADIPHSKAVQCIARVGVPKHDPVYGAKGPLLELWRTPRKMP
jgi:uncharacterized protein YjlB